MMQQITTRLDDTILFVLDYSRKNGKSDLSRMQIQKYLYLIQVESYKFLGEPFVEKLEFYRETNGPLSSSIYFSINRLVDLGYVKVHEIENVEYGHNRLSHELVKDFKLSFTQGELLFLSSIMSDNVLLTQAQLKQKAYKTEPMEEMLRQEHAASTTLLKGKILDMKMISLDHDVLEAMGGE